MIKLENTNALHSWLTSPDSFPAGTSDCYVMWWSDDVVYLLAWNTNLDYAGLEMIEPDSPSWTSVLFIRSRRGEHVDAVDFCKVSDYIRHLYVDDNNNVSIALLCQDYPEKMRDYFMQWCD